MKAKEFILLLFIIAAGVVLTLAHQGKINLFWDWDEGFFFRGEKYVFQENREVLPPFPTEIHVTNSRGRIDVRGTDDQKISITLDKEIWSRKEEKARNVAGRLKIQVKKYSGYLVISISGQDFHRRRTRTHFTLSVPRGIPLRVDNSYGKVKIEAVGTTVVNNRNGGVSASDISGNLTLTNSYSDVSIANVQENCEARSRNSFIRMSGIGGDVKMNHRYGKVHIEDVHGNVLVEGSHSEVICRHVSGETEIETTYRNITASDVTKITLISNKGRMELQRASGAVDIHGSYGQVDLKDIQGDCSIEGKYLLVRGDRIKGNVISVSTTYRLVRLDNFSGNTTIRVSNGEISLTPSPLLHPISAEGDYTDITFLWPGEEEYPIEARTKQGDIVWELDKKWDRKEKNGVSLLEAFGSVVEKPKIHLETRYGTIRIEKAPAY